MAKVKSVKAWQLAFVRDFLVLPSIPIPELLVMIMEYFYPSLEYMRHWMRCIDGRPPHPSLALSWSLDGAGTSSWCSLGREASLVNHQRLLDFVNCCPTVREQQPVIETLIDQFLADEGLRVTTFAASPSVTHFWIWPSHAHSSYRALILHLEFRSNRSSNF